MSKKIFKIIGAMVLSVCVIMGNTRVSNAAMSGTWNVNYTPGAPGSVSNQTSYIYMAFSENGYVANCTKISGSNGRRVVIDTSSAGGMKAVAVTAKGKTKKWTLNGKTTGVVTFSVSADAGYRCESTGVIKFVQ